MRRGSKEKSALAVVLAASLVVSGAFAGVPAMASAKKARLSRTRLTLAVGKRKTVKLLNAKKLSVKKAKKVKWSSSNKRAVTVSVKGKYRKKAVIQAKGVGKATVKLRYGGKTYRCKVVVRKVGGAETSGQTAGASAVPTTSASPGLTAAEMPETSEGPGERTDEPQGSGSPLPEKTPTASFASEYAGDDSLDGYVEPARAEYTEEDVDTGSEGADEILIPVAASGEKTVTDSYTISGKNKLTITASGTYVLRTEDTGTASDALVEVDYADSADTGTVHLILDGVNLMSSSLSEPDSDKGLITIKKSVAKAVITLAEGSTNLLTDVGEPGIDAEDGVSQTYTAGIMCKKTPLTINGSGSLGISSTYGNAIKCTNALKILNAQITAGTESLPLGHNGITGKTELSVKQADITVYACGDALKTTLDDDDVEEDGSLADLGNMELDRGEYDIHSTGQDAVSVYRTLFLDPETLEADASYTSSSSADDTSSKAVKAGTSIYIPETAGCMNLVSARDDTLHCNGYILIDGGTVTAASGDDGVHSDSGLQINAGTINITESYEGLESGDITICGGDITVKASDDGLNAAGGNSASSGEVSGGTGPGGFGPGGDNFNPKNESTADSSNYQIIITGGDLYIDAEGDGIDSNGNIFFQGGTVVVDGPTNSGNGALDYGDGNCVCEISGGTLIASGAKGMDEAPTSGSSQPTVNICFDQAMPASSWVVLRDSSGNDILAAQPSKKFQSVVMSCEALVLGGCYTVYYGNSMDTLTQGDSFTFSSVVMTTGSAFGGWNPGRR